MLFPRACPGRNLHSRPHARAPPIRRRDPPETPVPDRPDVREDRADLRSPESPPQRRHGPPVAEAGGAASRPGRYGAGPGRLHGDGRSRPGPGRRGGRGGGGLRLRRPHDRTGPGEGRRPRPLPGGGRPGSALRGRRLRRRHRGIRRAELPGPGPGPERAPPGPPAGGPAAGPRVHPPPESGRAGGLRDVRHGRPAPDREPRERRGADNAYTYLPRSVQAFPAPDALSGRLEAAGFSRTEVHLLTGGIAAIHLAYV